LLCLPCPVVLCDRLGPCLGLGRYVVHRLAALRLCGPALYLLGVPVHPVAACFCRRHGGEALGGWGVFHFFNFVRSVGVTNGARVVSVELNRIGDLDKPAQERIALNVMVAPGDLVGGLVGREYQGELCPEAYIEKAKEPRLRPILAGP